MVEISWFRSFLSLCVLFFQDTKTRVSQGSLVWGIGWHAADASFCLEIARLVNTTEECEVHLGTWHL